MRRTSRIALASAASLSVFGWLLAAGCSSSNNTTNNHVADASDDANTGDDTMVDSSTGDDNMDSSMVMPGDDDATTGEDSGHGGTDSGIHDASTDAHDDGGDAGDSGIHDAATDAHDASDASDADAGDSGAAATSLFLMGRWDTSGTSQAHTDRADWPGSAFEVTYTGSTITMNLTDQQRTFDPGTGSGTGDYVDVALYSLSTAGVPTQVNLACADIAISGTALTTGGTCTGTTSVRFPLPATALGTAGSVKVSAPTGTAGTTTAPLRIVVTKATDATAGTLTLAGTDTSPFTLDTNAAVLSKSYNFKYKFEFLGDDQVTGNGSIGTCNANAAQNGGVTPQTSDETASFTNLVSQHYSAEHTTIAESNMGLYIDGQGDPANTGEIMNTLFGETLPGATPTEAWMTANYQPDVVMINVGGISDAYQVNPSTGTAGETSAQYSAAYKTLFDTIHAAYPSAKILALIGPTNFANTLGPSDFTTYTNTAITNFKAEAGNANVAIDSLNVAAALTAAGNTAALACHYNPSSNDMTNIATVVETKLSDTNGVFKLTTN